MATQPHFLHFASSTAPNLRIVQLFFGGGLTKKRRALRSRSTQKLATSVEAKSAFIPRGSVCFRSEHRFWLVFLLLLFSSSREPGWPQCAGVASTPGAASDCAAHEIPAAKIATLDPVHAYSL